MMKVSNATAYQISGPEDAPAIVLIHGIGLNRHIWRDYEPELAQHYRVLSYDLFGHGDSAASEKTLSLTVFSEQLRELLDELGIEQCAVIGFSMGGMINRRFAMDHPQRCTALVVLNSPHERSPDGQRLVERRAAQTNDGGAAATLQAALERWFTPQFLLTQRLKISEVSKWVLATEPNAFRETRQILASGVIELIRPQPPITHSTLVMTCENDSGSTPAMAHAIASEIDGAQTIIIERLKHLGLLEQPAVFIESITRFLHKALT
jgi:pimeloyl-ACP methyl ester carboxylesterase